MSRDWLLYLGDLIESGEKIERFVTGRTFETFLSEEAIFDAVLFNLQVIGQATKKLPAEARSALSEAGGAGPARLRDLIAHHYFARWMPRSSGRSRPRIFRGCWPGRGNY